MKHNTGEAILILGAISFFMIIEGWSKWLLFLLVGLGIGTWSKHALFEERKELMKTSLVKLKLEIELMKAQTSFYIAQGAQIMRGLKR